MKTLLLATLLFILSIGVFAQKEMLTNEKIILMTRVGLSHDLIIRKIKDSENNFDTSTESLINLKKAGVSDQIITLMMDIQSKKKKISDDKSIDYSDSDNPPSFDFTKQNSYQTSSRIVLDKKEALRNAKTIAIKKSSLHPSRQALEKELLKRKDWKGLNLNIIRHKANADLYIEIGYVSMSWITHRYVYRIYDNKSGTVIAAGETTSWGSLAKNLARGISKRLAKVL